jgi:hypothetical protein
MVEFKNRRTVLEALKIPLEKKIFSILENFPSFKSKKNSKTLYHYTDLHSLKAIVENQSFFCSNSAYLNDKKEYYYGLDLFKNELQKIINSPKNDTSLNIVTAVLEELKEKNISNHFATCFSLEGDLLSQWRAYANDGKGIAIGLDRRKLLVGFENIATGFFIEYGSNNQLVLVNKLIETITDYYIEHFKLIQEIESEENVFKEIAQEINELLDKYIGHFKHSSFEEEKEFRFEMSTDKQFSSSLESISYRVGKNNLLVPYKVLKTDYAFEKERIKEDKISLELLEKNKKYRVKKIPISHIIIGPSLDFELNKHSIKDFLSKNGYAYVEIIPSEVPYRI